MEPEHRFRVRSNGLQLPEDALRGAERLLQTVIGAGNLRETTLFPRDIKRLAP